MSFLHNSGFLDRIHIKIITDSFSSASMAFRIPAAVILLAAVALLVYSNTFNAPFVFDDLLNITEQPKMRLTQITPETLARILKLSYRPLANLSFAFQYYLHGYDVRGFHAVNLAVHIITALLLWLVGRQTLRLCHLRDGIIPLLAAILWLVNPLHVQSVTYIVQRMNSMAAMFYLLALFCYIQARINAKAERGRLQRLLLYALCLMGTIFSLGSKQIAATLPVTLLLYEWFFFQSLDPAWLKKQLPWIGLAIFLCLIISVIYLGGTPFRSIAASYAKKPFTPAQRLLTEARVVVYYLSLLFFPHPARLNLDYVFPLSASPMDPAVTGLSLLAISALTAAALYRPGRCPLLSSAVLWFLGNLVIESSIIGRDIIFEHRSYLPSIFPALAVTVMLIQYLPRRVSLAGLGLMIIIGGAWTYQRNAVWRDDISLWADTAQKSPGKARPSNNLGNALKDRGRVDEAMAYYEKTLALDPDYYKAHNNLANALKTKGRMNEAVFHYQEALRLNPDLEEAHNNFGNALVSMGKLDEAIQHFQEAIRIKPDYDNAHYNMARAYQKKGMKEQARTHYLEALKIQPFFLEAHINLGGLCLNSNNPDKAIDHFKAALRINPGFAMGHNNLGIALEQKGLLKEAVEHYRQAVLLKPDYINAKNNLERALKTFQEKSK